MSTPLVLPSLGGDSSTVGEIIAIIDAGTSIAAGDILMEVETDKVVLEIPATQAGVISDIAVKVGDKVTGGMVVGSINAVAAKASATVQAPQPASDTTPTTENAEPVAAAAATTVPAPSTIPIPMPAAATANYPAAAAGPAARRMARQLGIAIGTVIGSGERARITKDDVIAHARQIIQDQPSSNVPPQPARRQLPDPGQHGPVHHESLNGIARATSRNMQFAWNEIPHAWVQEEIDITALEALRKQFKNAARGDMPLTVTAILCKVVALALRRFPAFNSVLDAEAEEIIYRDYINIGVAVDTPRGLVVPCLRDVSNKSAVDIGRELKAISEKAVAAKLTAQDFHGSGFTISNLGGLGVAGMFPIVNWPEVAILGVASSRERCVLANGDVCNRLIMPLTLGFDHRVINGADAARFLGFIKQCVEEPGMLLIAA